MLPLPDDENGCYDAPSCPAAKALKGKLVTAFVTTPAIIPSVQTQRWRQRHWGNADMCDMHCRFGI